MSTLYFLVQQTMFCAIPLLIVAIGAMYSERSGIINIALEGIMVMGAFTSIMFINIMQTNGIMDGQLLLLVAILIAGLSGGIFSLLHAFAAIKLRADQTISGTALNMFAAPFAIYIARMLTPNHSQQVQFTDTFHIDSVPVLGSIPVIGDLFFKNTYITTYLGIIIFIIGAFVISKTRFGLRLRACGEHPQAADAVGVNVYKIRYSGVFISGVLAGIGGLVFVVPTSVNFNGTVSGYGFLALAVLIFGQWRSAGIIKAAFFFGIMQTIASSYSGIPVLQDLPIPNGVYKMIPYIATMIILAFFSKSSQAPRAEGVPYDKGSR